MHFAETKREGTQNAMHLNYQTRSSEGSIDIEQSDDIRRTLVIWIHDREKKLGNSWSRKVYNVPALLERTCVVFQLLLEHSLLR